jgi:tight adherence protein C
MIDGALVLLLMLVIGSLAWIERERLSMLVSMTGADGAMPGGYYARLTRHAGLSPTSLWSAYWAAKVLLAALVPLLLMELTGAGAVLLLLAPAGFFLPDGVLAYLRQRRQREIRRSLSFFLDLLLSLVQAGMSLEEAFAIATREGLPPSSPLGREALLVVEEMNLGRDRSDAFQVLADRTGVEELRGVANAMSLAISRGASLETTLKGQADLARAKRREEGMARVQVASAEVLFPLVLCSFPVFVVLVFIPLAMRVWQSFESLGMILRQ